MRRLPFSFALPGAMVFSSALLAAALALPGAARADGPVRTITVTGEASVARAPDMATISIGVTNTGASAAEAMAANAAAMTKVIAQLKAAGIAEGDLQTSGLALHPEYDNGASGQEDAQNRKFRAMNMLTVGIRDLDGLGGVLDVLVAEGANTLNGVSFGLLDPAPALDEARREAVADARARAGVLADAAGVKLGDLLSVTEGYGHSGGPAPLFRAEAASVPVERGEVSYQATATLVWELAE